jgi:hypothetical protein
MATKDELKEYIKGRVKTNTNKEITGNSLQTVLCRMVDELDLNDSCQVVLIRYTNGPTTFSNLKELYDANKAVIVQFGEGYNVLITQVSSTAFTGYRFNLNSGSTGEGGLGIVSMTATRYTFTEEGLTLDNFTVSSNGGSGGDQPASLTWAYSDYEGDGTPPDPDTDPSLWYAVKKDSSVWAALKEEGGAWNIWRLKPYTGKDGRGIKTTQVSYVLSDQGITPPTTGWNVNMPNIEVGKYLWSRTIITYTDDTTSTVYSVTYIGKDGNDGKNGTSVTIKGTIKSIDDLPMDPKPTPGDGYIINGDLWTYTGTTLENDENHRGFTNVGPIKGDQGNSACLHIAWANSLAPDWANFTTQKPSGQKFKYMGTYVDYSADPSTCVDSQNPTDYHWQDVSGEDGESAIVADLDNEIESIALSYDGRTESAWEFSPVVSMWYGLKKLTLDSLTTKLVGNTINSVHVVSNVSTGKVTVSIDNNSLVDSFQVEITVKATVKEQSYIKQVVFSVNCVKAGTPGEDVTLYSLKPSVSVIHKDKNGNLDPVSITCKKLKTVGSTQEETQDGVLKYKIDSGSLLNYSGAIDCSRISSKIHFEYSVDGVLWDTEDVFIILDGKDGDDGDTPYIIESKTKTEYAITTNTEVPTSWSPTPVEGIPGQYLWIRITYTWSNGSTTVSLSYSRCGSDGSSAISKATVVNYQGPWKADGLYTGMEDDTTIRVDVVYYQGPEESEGKYYLAIQSKQFIDQTTPAPNTAEGKAYWGAFQGQFANIATGLLFTENAVIENAIVRVLQTASKGARVETEGNEMAVYDKDDIQRILIDPESNEPFTTMGDDFTNVVDQLGVMIPITSLYGQNYTGGTIKIVYYDSNNDWDDKVVQADALIIALVTGDTYDHVYKILDDNGNNGIIPISSGNSENVILDYIEKHLNSDLMFWTIKTGNTETIKYDPLRIGFEEEEVDRIIAQGGTSVIDITLIPDWVIGGEKASLKQPDVEPLPDVVVSPKDRYKFPGSTVLAVYNSKISQADHLEYGPTSSAESQLSKISGFEGDLGLHLVLKNKTQNTECVLMSLTGDYPISFQTLLDQEEFEAYFPSFVSSGDSKTEVREAIPELVGGVYEVVLRITRKVLAKGTGWETLTLQGIEFLFNLKSSVDSSLIHPLLILNTFNQGQSIKIHSSGISLIRSGREYFQLSLKDINDQGDRGLDLEMLAKDYGFKFNSQEAFMGPIKLYTTEIPHYRPRPGYGVVDISNYGVSLNNLGFTKNSMLVLMNLVQHYPVYLQTCFGIAPLVITRNNNGAYNGLSASLIATQEGTSGWTTVRHDFWLSNSTIKFTYRQVTL